MANKSSLELIDRLNMPVRYRRGGVVDKDSFLREKLFHKTDPEELISLTSENYLPFQEKR